jgi:hypothetical protein
MSLIHGDLPGIPAAHRAWADRPGRSDLCAHHKRPSSGHPTLAKSSQTTRGDSPAHYRAALAETGFRRGAREAFISLLGGATAWPFNAYAQGPAKVWRIAYLSPARDENEIVRLP